MLCNNEQYIQGNGRIERTGKNMFQTSYTLFNRLRHRMCERLKNKQKSCYFVRPYTTGNEVTMELTTDKVIATH